MSSDFHETKHWLSQQQALFSFAQQKLSEEKSELLAAEALVVEIAEAQKHIQEVAQAVQQSAHQRISQVVSRCLSAVFGDGAYEFRINFVQARGKTSAELVFVRDGNEIAPTEGAGLGACDVAAFALRAAALCLSRPQQRRLLVLDEPFRHVSREYREKTAEMLEMMSEELGIQIIQITHFQEHTVGKVYKIG